MKDRFVAWLTARRAFERHCRPRRSVTTRYIDARQGVTVYAYRPADIGGDVHRFHHAGGTGLPYDWAQEVD